MSSDRSAVPRAIERQVLIEAGHRCAIPSCRQIPVEIAHIVPWADVRKHEFENLIALCPTCHTRYDSGQIDRSSMRQYKANLSVLNSRYGDLERRVLVYYAEHPNYPNIYLPAGLALLLMYLLKDGLLEHAPLNRLSGLGDVQPGMEGFRLTQAGREFVEHWLAADPVDSRLTIGLID
jgi:hypothetical protein